MTARPGDGHGHGPGRGNGPRQDDPEAYGTPDARHGEHGQEADGGREGDDDGMDALMAAVLGVPAAGLPEEARADSAYLAAHRSATADVALLREQLGVLADVLTGPVPEGAPAGDTAVAPTPLRRTRPPRRIRPLALRLAGAAAAGALLLGGGWAVVRAGGFAGVQADKSADSAAADEKAQSSAGAGASMLGDPGYLACARLVVEGEVTAVDRVPGTGRERITLRVTHAWRPASGGPEVGFVMEEDMDPLLAEGDHVLVAIGKGSVTPDVWVVGEADIAPEREALTRALPEAAAARCA
ncbi:hypothetical protein [Streptomyces asoensis]|uniref:hypothetical protein n=1 Tax=Streptomyces asoensis TaxID=249586 RepID=UPI0033C29853